MTHVWLVTLMDRDYSFFSDVHATPEGAEQAALKRMHEELEDAFDDDDYAGLDHAMQNVERREISEDPDDTYAFQNAAYPHIAIIVRKTPVEP